VAAGLLCSLGLADTGALDRGTLSAWDLLSALTVTLTPPNRGEPDAALSYAALLGALSPAPGHAHGVGGSGGGSGGGGDAGSGSYAGGSGDSGRARSMWEEAKAVCADGRRRLAAVAAATALAPFCSDLSMQLIRARPQPGAVPEALRAVQERACWEPRCRALLGGRGAPPLACPCCGLAVYCSERCAAGHGEHRLVDCPALAAADLAGAGVPGHAAPRAPRELLELFEGLAARGAAA
jgi:hypothetical protein